MSTADTPPATTTTAAIMMMTTVILPLSFWVGVVSGVVVSVVLEVSVEPGVSGVPLCPLLPKRDVLEERGRGFLLTIVGSLPVAASS